MATNNLSHRLAKLRIQPAENVKFTFNGCFINTPFKTVELRHKHIIHSKTKPAMFNDWYFIEKPEDLESLIRVLSFFGAEKEDMQNILNPDLTFDQRATLIKDTFDGLSKVNRSRGDAGEYYMKILVEDGRGKYSKFLFICRGITLPIMSRQPVLKYSEEEKEIMQIKLV